MNRELRERAREVADALEDLSERRQPAVEVLRGLADENEQLTAALSVGSLAHAMHGFTGAASSSLQLAEYMHARLVGSDGNTE